MNIAKVLRSMRAENERPFRLVNAIRSVRVDRLVKALRAVRAADERAELHASRMTFKATWVKLRARSSSGNRPFSGVAYTGGIFFPSITINGRSERGPVILDLDTLTIPKPERPVLDDHDESPEGVIGTTTMIAVQKPEYTLPVKGVIFGEKDRSQKFLQAARGGHKWQLSVGTDNFTLERIPAGQKVFVNGETFMGPVTVARNGYLTDLSFVAIGGDDKTEATIEAARAGSFSLRRLIQSR